MGLGRDQLQTLARSRCLATLGTSEDQSSNTTEFGSRPLGMGHLPASASLSAFQFQPNTLLVELNRSLSEKK